MKTLFIAEKEELQALIKESIHEELEALLKTLSQKEVPDKLSLIDAQQYLNLSKSKLYKLTLSREIPYHKLGKRIFFYRQELDQWISQFARHYKTREEIANEHLKFLARKKR
jgi:excisionase family DNA binding protein